MRFCRHCHHRYFVVPEGEDQGPVVVRGLSHLGAGQEPGQLAPSGRLADHRPAELEERAEEALVRAEVRWDTVVTPKGGPFAAALELPEVGSSPAPGGLVDS